MYDSIARYFQINIYCGGDGVPWKGGMGFSFGLKSAICMADECVWFGERNLPFAFSKLYDWHWHGVFVSLCADGLGSTSKERVIHPQTHVNTASADSINGINMKREEKKNKVCGSNFVNRRNKKKIETRVFENTATYFK